MSLELTNIPKIMRSKKWDNGAQLMERWFSSPPFIAPAYGPPDLGTIKMEWVLRFPRAKEVYDELVNERVWANKPAQLEIAKMLKRKKFLGSNPVLFGSTNQPLYDIDRDYIQRRSVDIGWFAELNDMTASLGNFTFHVVVAAGFVEPIGRQHQVTIYQVGVYVRDSYDFNDDPNEPPGYSDSLGVWDDEDNSVSKGNPWSGTEVHNSDFRNWRKDNRRGGDFLVFSDIKLITLNPPDKFTV